MRDSAIICLICYVFSALLGYVAEPIKLPPVKCNEPVLATVKVDPQHRFFPYYVRLHRCEGSWEGFSPKIKKCVATGRKEIEIKVFSVERKKSELLHMYNHTSCGAECTTDKCKSYVEWLNEDTCECECLFDDAPPPNIMKRKKDSRWNKLLCKYECSRSASAACSRKKKLDRKTCSCVCKRVYKRACENRKVPLNPDTCECDESSASHGMSKGSITYVVIGAVLVVIALFVLSLCYRRRCKRSSLQRPKTNQMAPETSSDATTYSGSDRSSDCQISEGQIKSHHQFVTNV